MVFCRLSYKHIPTRNCSRKSFVFFVLVLFCRLSYTTVVCFVPSVGVTVFYHKLFYDNLQTMFLCFYIYSCNFQFDMANFYIFSCNFKFEMANFCIFSHQQIVHSFSLEQKLPFYLKAFFLFGKLLIGNSHISSRNWDKTPIGNCWESMSQLGWVFFITQKILDHFG